jgi:hypothetical protein
MSHIFLTLCRTRPVANKVCSRHLGQKFCGRLRYHLEQMPDLLCEMRHCINLALFYGIGVGVHGARSEMRVSMLVTGTHTNGASPPIGRPSSPSW